MLAVDFERGMSFFPPVSLVLAVSCLTIFVAELGIGSLDSLEALVNAGALEAGHVVQGDYWRLLSAVFLHGSADHVLGNAAMLYVLGMGCEHALGSKQCLTLFVGAGLFGSGLSLMMSDLPSVGASGAIFGLGGAMMVFFRRFHGGLHVRDRRIGIVVAIWALYQLALGSFVPGVDNYAHLGGLLGGILFGLVASPAILEGRERTGARLSVKAGFIFSVLLLAACAAKFLPRLAG